MKGKKSKYIFIFIFIALIAMLDLTSQVIPAIKKANKDNIFKTIVGADVKIEIAMNGVEPSLVSIKCNANPYLAKVDDSTYLIRFVQKMDEVKVKLYYKNLPVGIKTYSITDLPLPSYMIDGSEVEIKKSSLNKPHTYNIKWDNGLELDPNSLRLYNARVNIVENNKPPLSFQMRQMELPQQVFNMLPSTGRESNVTISDISFLTTYGSVINVTGSWTFKVVE